MHPRPPHKLSTIPMLIPMILQVILLEIYSPIQRLLFQSIFYHWFLHKIQLIRLLIYNIALHHVSSYIVSRHQWQDE